MFFIKSSFILSYNTSISIFHNFFEVWFANVNICCYTETHKEPL